DGRAAGQQRHRLREAAVVGQRAEQRVYIEQVGHGIAATAAAVADQVVPRRRKGANEVRSGARVVARENGVPQVDRGAAIEKDAAAAVSRVSGYGAVVDGQQFSEVGNAASIGGNLAIKGAIAGDRAVADVEHPFVKNAAAL